MGKYDDIYGIFGKCFPELPLSYDSFTELLTLDECEILKRTENGASVSFAVIKDNNILLLCTLPEYRNKGLGSALLVECEEVIGSGGGKSVSLGGNNWFFLGAVLSEEEWQRNTSDFFAKRGYKFGDGCMEMSMKTADFDRSLIPVPAAPAEFRFVRPDEHEMLIEAVAKVEEKWCKYFTEDECVFAGFFGGKIVSFCIVEDNCTTLLSSETANVGSVGCVGTIPEMRRNGIGLTMVGKASALLCERGCTDIYIHYTYLDKWYGKLGFKTFLYFGKGEKALDSR